MDTAAAEQKRPQRDFQVFLSFRGVDTRYGFTDCLYHFLTDAGIRVFRDSEELHVGERISVVVEKINNSVVCIPILSPNYAKDSKWCLRELAEMVKLRKDILPVFFKVKAEDVKLRTPLYKEALDQYGEETDAEKAEWEVALQQVGGIPEKDQWEGALEKAGRIKAWSVTNETGYGAICKSIVEEVLVKLEVRHQMVPRYLVRFENQVEYVKELLDIESPDVRFVGIHGTGGIGKTTLAKVVYNELSSSFDGSSFINDIAESSRHSLVSSQKHLLYELLSRRLNLSSTDQGMKAIRDVVHNKKLLIVLDNVDSVDQIAKLVGNHSWFGSGSRIIITTRDVRVLSTEQEFTEEGVTRHSREIKKFEMWEMDFDQALELFHKCAFGEDSPQAAYLDLSREVVSATAKLPLFLELIGSHLRGKSIDEWKEKIRKLKKIPPKNIQNRLMISYEELDIRTKQIFLDIACFFVDTEKTNAFYMWKACKFHPQEALEELISLSLVKIVDKDRLWMHDHLRQLGREMVSLESFIDLGKRSRLWEHEEALGVLKRREGTRETEALRLSNDDCLTGYSFTGEELKGLQNLRFFECSGLNFSGDMMFVLLRLRWFSWHCCSSNFEATNFNLENLVILDLSWSDIREDWKGWTQIKMGETLKVLDLTSCKGITRTPDFTKYTNLERLVLEGCTMLIEIHCSIGKLKRLKHLNAKGCTSLKVLPNELCSLGALEEILVKGNGGAFTLPSSIGELKSLKVLEIIEVRMTELPTSIGRLRKLKRLSLSGCWIKELPPSFAGLMSLVELDLSKTEVPRLPESIDNLVKLERLSISQCSMLEELPTSFGYLNSLVELDISHTPVTSLPPFVGDQRRLKVIMMKYSKISTLSRDINMARKLEELYAGSSRLTGEIPREIKRLTHLKILDFSYSRITVLPSLRKLSLLQTLNLEGCNQLQTLSGLPASLMNLRLTSSSLYKLPNLSEQTNLMNLKLYLTTERSERRNQQHFNFEWIGKLPKLSTLDLHLSNATNLPTDFDGFSRLKVLKISCPSLGPCAPRLPPTLSRLVLGSLGAAQLPPLAHLKNLSFLGFSNCMAEGGFGNLGLEELVSLNVLEVKGCNFTKLSGGILPENLEVLDIARCKSLSEVSHLLELENLKKLNLTECEILANILGLGKMKSLLSLTISHCDSLESLDDLSGLEKLEDIRIESCRMLREVRGLESLETLKTCIVPGKEVKRDNLGSGESHPFEQ